MSSSKFAVAVIIVVSLSVARAYAAMPNDSHKDVVQKSKSDRCPSGYRINGNYCEAYRPGTHAVKKEGACPSGYRTSGTYCVKN
jgi:hypothetical protein